MLSALMLHWVGFLRCLEDPHLACVLSAASDRFRTKVQFNEADTNSA